MYTFTRCSIVLASFLTPAISVAPASGAMPMRRTAMVSHGFVSPGPVSHGQIGFTRGPSFGLCNNGGACAHWQTCRQHGMGRCSYMPMSAYMMGSYGSGYGSGYGGGSGGGSAFQPPIMAPAVFSTAAEEEPNTSLDALGLPNSGGHLDWPLGLRVLAPGLEARALRQQTDQLLQTAALASTTGQVNPRVIKETSQTVQRLRRMLSHEGSACLASATTAEAQQFLDKLEHVLDTLK